MKLNTKTLLAAALTVALVAASFGQAAGPAGGARQGAPGQKGGQRGGQRGGGGRMMKMDQEILAKLNLSADQQSKIKALKEKLATDMKAQWEKNKGDREAMRSAFKSFGKAYRDGLGKVLTPAQKTQYQAEMKKRMEEMKKRREAGGGRPGTPPSR